MKGAVHDKQARKPYAGKEAEVDGPIGIGSRSGAVPYKSSEAPTLETPLPLEKRAGTPPKVVGGEVDLLQRHLAAKTFSERL